MAYRAYLAVMAHRGQKPPAQSAAAERHPTGLSAVDVTRVGDRRAAPRLGVDLVS